MALPDLEHAKAAVLNSLSSLSGQRAYDHAIDEFWRGLLPLQHLADAGQMCVAGHDADEQCLRISMSDASGEQVLASALVHS
jgi:hypothetical protein